MNRRFDHEKLEVYQVSLAFITWLEPILQKLPKPLSVTDQLDRASTSIPLNIVEGNGKFTGADRCRYFDRLDKGQLRLPVARGKPGIGLRLRLRLREDLEKSEMRTIQPPQTITPAEAAPGPCKTV